MTPGRGGPRARRVAALSAALLAACGTAATPTDGAEATGDACAAPAARYSGYYGDPGFDQRAVGVARLADDSLVLVGNGLELESVSTTIWLVGISPAGEQLWDEHLTLLSVREDQGLPGYARGSEATYNDPAGVWPEGDDGSLLVAGTTGESGWLVWLGADHVATADVELDVRIRHALRAPDGALAVGDAGRQVASLTAAGDVAWSAQAGGEHAGALTTVTLTGSGALAAGGSFAQQADAPLDAMITLYDETGAPVWTRWLGGSCDDVLDALGPHPDGGLVAAVAQPTTGGAVAGEARTTLVHLTADGEVAWAHLLEVQADLAPSGLQASGDGDDLMLFGAGVAGDTEAWLVLHTDASGWLRWGGLYPFDTGTAAFAATHLADGGILLAGRGVSAHPFKGNLGTLVVDVAGTCPASSAATSSVNGDLNCAAVPDEGAVAAAPGAAALTAHGCAGDWTLSFDVADEALVTGGDLCVGEDPAAPPPPEGLVAASPALRVHPTLDFLAAVPLTVQGAHPADAVLLHDPMDGRGWRALATSELDGALTATVTATGRYLVATPAPE